MHAPYYIRRRKNKEGIKKTLYNKHRRGTTNGKRARTCSSPVASATRSTQALLLLLDGTRPAACNSSTGRFLSSYTFSVSLPLHPASSAFVL